MVSICVTVFNEEKSIGPLLDSLLAQSKNADEIVIVDGGSTDKTIEIINHYQKRFNGIKLLKEKCSRAEGRNLSVEIAKNEIVAMTDAGCVARHDWLKNLCAPLANPEIEVAAGFYEMTGGTPVSRAMAVFLGTGPSDFDITFLPSTRSIAFRKEVWEKVGGFPQENGNSAEDTYFNYRLLKHAVKMARVKNAVVEWGMPETIGQFKSKIQNYAKWDAKTKIWFFPGKGLASHNIKALSVLFRYLVALVFLVYSLIFNSPLLVYWLIGLSAYLIFAYRKAKIWGIVLQFVSDFGVMSGFLTGVFRK